MDILENHSMNVGWFLLYVKVISFLQQNLFSTNVENKFIKTLNLFLTFVIIS